MKKIIIGLIQTSISPFIVILGYCVISRFYIPESVQIFCFLLGGTSVIFNFIIGIFLIIKGYQENETFKGW